MDIINTTCPCCSRPMLHHISNHRDYWFCRHCWQEMPNLSTVERPRLTKKYQPIDLSIGLPKIKTPVLV